MDSNIIYSFKKGTPVGKIREARISEYSSRLNKPHCIGRNAQYNLKAYQIMTNEEILLSEERESRGEATYDSIKKLREFIEWSARPNPNGPRAKSVA